MRDLTSPVKGTGGCLVGMEKLFCLFFFPLRHLFFASCTLNQACPNMCPILFGSKIKNLIHNKRLRAPSDTMEKIGCRPMMLLTELVYHHFWRRFLWLDASCPKVCHPKRRFSFLGFSPKRNCHIVSSDFFYLWRKLSFLQDHSSKIHPSRSKVVKPLQSLLPKLTCKFGK